MEVQQILEDFRDLKRLGKTRAKKASTLIGSIVAANGEVKEDKLEIANAFADFYKTLYADAGKILDEISALGPNALDNTKEVSKDEVAEQLKRLEKARVPTSEGW